MLEDASEQSLILACVGQHDLPQLTVPDGAGRRQTYRQSTGRQAPATAACGGMPHVSPGGAATTEKEVFFSNSISRWSFLSMNWVRWSLLPKFQLTTIMYSLRDSKTHRATAAHSVFTSLTIRSAIRIVSWDATVQIYLGRLWLIGPKAHSLVNLG
jgi:hypothetical protein